MAVSIPGQRDTARETEERSTTPAGADRSPRGTEARRPSERREAGPGPRSAAEWIALTISSLIVLGLIAVATYFYLTDSNAPAAIEVEPLLAETYQVGSRFYLPVKIRNIGGETGEEVRVRVSVTDRSGRQEAAEVMVTFLAGGGSSRAAAAFGSDPRQGQVEAVVVSYLEP